MAKAGGGGGRGGRGGGGRGKGGRGSASRGRIGARIRQTRRQISRNIKATRGGRSKAGGRSAR